MPTITRTYVRRHFQRRTYVRVIVGTSRVTATRIVGSLVDRGIIQRHQRHFIISLVGEASLKENRDPFWHYEI